MEPRYVAQPAEGKITQIFADGEGATAPVVLFVVDADREVGRYARLDRQPPPGGDKRTTPVPLAMDRDLSPKAIAALVSELRQTWAVSRRSA